MKYFVSQFNVLIVFILTSFAIQAEQQEALGVGYIIDDLVVYTHSGAGSQYRITGTLVAGSQVKLTGASENGFTQIITNNNKQVWIKDEYLSDKPGLRFIIADQNTQLASETEKNQSLQAQLSAAEANISTLTEQNEQLTKQLANKSKLLSAATSKLDSQDLDLKKQWFFNGAIVLGIGLLLGIVLPRISFKKKSNMNSWK
jgi:SH3 domain protein